MSVIGWVLTCEDCGVRMVVTVEDRHIRCCPDCLLQRVQDAIDDLGNQDDTADYPLGEVRG